MLPFKIHPHLLNLQLAFLKYKHKKQKRQKQPRDKTEAAAETCPTFYREQLLVPASAEDGEK